MIIVKQYIFFNLNKKYDLDGDFKYNTARLINHSCDPNCEVDGIGLKIWVYSIRNIKKEKNYLTIMVLVLMKIFEIILVSVDLEIVWDTLLDLSLDGESKNLRIINLTINEKILFISTRNPFSGRYSGDVIRAEKFVYFLSRKNYVKVISLDDTSYKKKIVS